MKASYSLLLLLLLHCSVFEGQMLTQSQHEYRDSKENEIQVENLRPEDSPSAFCEQYDIQTILRKMSAMLAELKVEQRHTTTAMNNIETRLRASENQIEELKRTNGAQIKVNEALAANQSAMEEKLSNKVEELETKHDVAQKDLKTSLANTANQVENLERENQVSKVAFSAGLTDGPDGHTGPFNTDIVLVFKFVYTNFGQAYNPNTGIFTAPVKGVYHFRFSIHGAAPHPITVALHKNNDHMTGTYAHQSQNSVSSTNAISMLLEVGDVVFLRLIAKTWVYDNFFHHTTFSGHLLFSI